MPRYHNINGENVQFTPEEEIARDAEEATWVGGASARAAERVQVSRRAAYEAETDTLFFEEQAGEVAAGTWAAKRAEIKARFPKD
jgi:phosphopantetheinyl transferase (holo-ACP synthase)